MYAITTPGLAIAKPVFTGPAISAYIRPDSRRGEAGTAVSETRTPFCRVPKIARPVGALSPPAGTTRAYPVCRVPDPVVVFDMPFLPASAKDTPGRSGGMGTFCRYEFRTNHAGLGRPV